MCFGSAYIHGSKYMHVHNIICTYMGMHTLYVIGVSLSEPHIDGTSARYVYYIIIMVRPTDLIQRKLIAHAHY